MATLIPLAALNADGDLVRGTLYGGPATLFLPQQPLSTKRALPLLRY